MIAGIKQAKDLHFHNVVFTGGEATLRWDDLLVAIRYATSRELPTRLVTNAHWATSDDEAERIVGDLVRAGLKEINFSTGDEHVRFVRLINIVYAVMASLKHKLQPWVMIELKDQRVITQQVLLEHPLILQMPIEQQQHIKVIESPWMPLKPSTIDRYPDGIAINAETLSATTGCDSVLQTYVLQADGRIGACCGIGMRIVPELNVGILRDESSLQKAICDAESDFMKAMLHFKGAEKILAWCAEKDPSIEWENMYAHRCQACLSLYRNPKIRDIIFRYHTELFPEILQSAWLDGSFYAIVSEQ
jgi:hypothetical protein